MVIFSKISDWFLPIKPNCSSRTSGLKTKPFKLSPLTDALVKALSITFLETLAKFSLPIKYLKSFIADGDPALITYLNNSSDSIEPGLSKPFINIFLSAFVNC